MFHRRIALLAALWAVVNGAMAGRVVDNAALNDEKDGRNWAAISRTFSEQRFSPLAQVNDHNVKQLGLAWSLDLPGFNSVSTEPIAVDGVLYFAVGQAVVHAVDVRSGKLLWKYDPEVYKVAGHKLRLAWGSRGVAFWKGKVFVGTLDGRLIAINARTGKPVWSVQTTESGDDRDLPVLVLPSLDRSAIRGRDRTHHLVIVADRGGLAVVAVHRDQHHPIRVGQIGPLGCRRRSRLPHDPLFVVDSSPGAVRYRCRDVLHFLFSNRRSLSSMAVNR